MDAMMSKPFFHLYLVACLLVLTASPVPAASLERAIAALLIAAGEEGADGYDSSHNGTIGLEDALVELRLLAEGGPPPVALPALRLSLPGSWDEDWFASPAVYDLDGDGDMEIVAGRHSVLYVWDHLGALVWTAPVGQNRTSTIVHGSARQYASPVVGDLDGDGKGEIAIAFSDKVALYEHDGMLKSGWPQSFPGSSNEIRAIAADDLDDDGVMEILAVKTSTGPVTVVWKINGAISPGWPQVTGCADCNDFGGYNQNIGAADIDGDGALEVISTYDICHIGFNEGDGSPLPAHPMFAGSYASSVPMFHRLDLAIQGWGANGNDRDEFTDSPPVFADLDRDGKPEVILYSDHEQAGIAVNIGNCLWALNEDMTRVAGFETPICSGGPIFTGYQNNIVQVAPAPALGDLQGDVRLEIVVPSYDGYMRAYAADGVELWRYQFDPAGGSFLGASGAAVGDLGGDVSPEIVFSTYSTEAGISHLIMLDARGVMLHRVPLSGRGSMSVPTLADVDGDGDTEIVVSLKDQIGGGIAGVQIYDVAGALSDYLPWPTGRGTLLRNGRPARW